ncbi:cation transporter [Lewinellaceae bacterium SD302]|nr:cation transporter [Lewinellaceae bacterium SD302]
MLARYIRFFLENKLVAYLLLLLFVGWGLVTAPFNFGIDKLPRDPVAVDAIPDIGENQQIVFTNWPGRSPQDVEDQITYPLTTALFGIPGVKSVRSNSMFGFSSIYLIFDEDIEFYWSRSRILEKLNSLPANTLPEGVQPTLGPDATALGQIFWYTLEGRDAEGNPTGGWDLHELRSIQDFYVRYGLSSAGGVAEVASIGGHVKEYQVDVDPEAMRIYGVTLEQVMQAVRGSNLDVGAQTIEINRAEYFVRGLGYVKNIGSIEQSPLSAPDNVPVTVGDVARVSIGPAARRGVLDKSGAEAVGGVVVARYGANPLAVINNVKAKITELEAGLPQKTLADGTVSKLAIVPFYDRTQLINETIGTLQEAISLQVLITVIVIVLMLLNLKSSLLVAGSLPVAVLMCFVAMRYFGVDANIVALSGIAIAIGTMVDMGIVLSESMVNRLEEAPPEESLFTSIYESTVEVASAVLTAVATTVISFLPVFAMEAAEGKLFRPLAYTKTFALVASIIVAVSIIPPLAHSLFSLKIDRRKWSVTTNALLVLTGLACWVWVSSLLGAGAVILGLFGLLRDFKVAKRISSSERFATFLERWFPNLLIALLIAWLLTTVWMPLGVERSEGTNYLFVVLVAGGLIGFFYLLIYFYENILRFLLRFKILFLLLVGILVFQGYQVYQHTGEEFMPALDEGSFLLMPTSMPHAGMEENTRNLRLLDMAVTAIPEVETVVGKAGRVNSPLDPAPMSMYENVILYKSEYKTDEQGHRLRFRYADDEYERDDQGELIPDEDGRYYRQWREGIKSPDDIWQEIVRVTDFPGVTSAPKLQPIETRLVMLQTGMRAPMGIKVRGPDLATIEAFGLQLEKALKDVEGVKEAAVFADRIVGKPYLLLDIQRGKIARYGLTVADVQRHIQAAIGGMIMTTTVEGRERYAIRVRYPRELRNAPDALADVYVPTENGQPVPLGELVKIRYEQGPQSIKSEDGFLLGYVLFDRQGDYSEVEVVNNAQAFLDRLIDTGELIVPAGISYRFAGNYEQQVRASERLSLVVPIALVLIFLILYFQFKSVPIALMVFSGVFIAFSGGFIMIGLYDTSWFLNVDFFGVNMRDLFQIQSINLSVAVWVGFLALFGIATDDGVLVATFLQDSFRKNQPESIAGIRDAVVEGGLRRVRPAMMTTATTILALLPILTSTGRGADIMLPMAIPSFGGMAFQMITMFTVPILYALWQETRHRLSGYKGIATLKSKKYLLFLLLLAGAGSLQAQSIEELERQLSRNNPELAALRNEYRAALEVAPQLRQLPDPEIGVGGFPLPVETRVGAQRARLSVGQRFPWFGTLNARAELGAAKAEPLNAKIGAQELELSYELRRAYFQLYELRERREIIARNLEILAAMEKLGLAKVASGKASSADVLRIQLQEEELLQELAILASQQAIPTAEINRLLNSSVNREITITDSLGFASLSFSRDSLMAEISVNHPVIRMFELRQEVSRAAISLNELSGKPEFSVGLDYILVDERSDVSIENNGRDILQLKASVRLPLSRGKYAAKEREERLMIDAAEARKSAALSRFSAAVEQAFSKYDQAKLRYELSYQQERLTRAARDILQAGYRAEGKSFDELLRLERELIDYELKRLSAIVASHQAKNEIQRLTTNQQL